MPDVLLGAASGNPLLKTPTTTVFADNFNRGNANLAGQVTPVGAKTWEAVATGGGTNYFVVSGNAAGGLSPANSRQFAVINCGSGDGILRTTYRGGGANAQIMIPFRVAVTDALNNYMNLTVANGRWVLRKVTPGAGEQLVGTTPIAVAAGQIVEVALTGPLIKIYINSVLAATFTETDNQTNPRHGIGSLAAATTTPVVLWDDVSFTIPGT